MEPFEIMVSESQERMLCVVRARARSTRCSPSARSWEVHGTAIGEVTDTRRDAHLPRRRARRRHAGRGARRRLPGLRARARSARPRRSTPPPRGDARARAARCTRRCSRCSPRPTSPRAGRCSSSTTGSCSRARCAAPRRPTPRCSRCPTAAALGVSHRRQRPPRRRRPLPGHDRGVLECAANLACVGAEPLGMTNNLNFGNPEKPHIAWQLTEAVRGLGDALPRARRAGHRRQRLALQRGRRPARSTRRRSSAWSAACPTRARAGRLGFAREGDAIALAGWDAAPSLAGERAGQAARRAAARRPARRRPRARARGARGGARRGARRRAELVPRRRRGRLRSSRVAECCLAGGLGADARPRAQRRPVEPALRRAPGRLRRLRPARRARRAGASACRSTSSAPSAATRSSSRSPARPRAGRWPSCARPTARWRGFFP